MTVLHKKSVLHFIVDIVAVAACVVFLSPVLLGLLNSFKPLGKILSNPLSISWDTLSLDAYIVAFNTMSYGRHFINNVIITGFSLLFVILCASMCAYKLSRDHSRLSRICFNLIIAFILVPFQCTMIPLTVELTRTGLVDSLVGVIICYIGFGTPMSMFLYHGYIKSIPTALDESAKLDGCNTIKTFFWIIFPLAAPMTATVVIIETLFFWNDFLFPLIVLQSDNNRTLITGLVNFSATHLQQWDKLLAGTVMIELPILALYLILQRYIIDGLVTGAVKS